MAAPLHAVIPTSEYTLVLKNNVTAVAVEGVVVVSHEKGAEIVGPGDTVDGYYVVARGGQLVLMLPGFGASGTARQENVNMDATHYIGCHRLAKQRGETAAAVLATRGDRFVDQKACTAIADAAMARDVWFALAGTTGVVGLGRQRARSTAWANRGLAMTQTGVQRPVTQIEAFGIRHTNRAVAIGRHWLHQDGPTMAADISLPFTLGGLETEDEAWRRVVAEAAPRATGSATINEATSSNPRTLLRTIPDLPMLYQIRSKARHRLPKIFEPANRKPLIKLTSWDDQKITKQVKKMRWFGIKFDGIRISLHVDKNREARLYSKRGTNITRIHAKSFVQGGFAFDMGVLRAPEGLRPCILDGEYIRQTGTVTIGSKDVPARTRHNAPRWMGRPRFAVYDCATAEGGYEERMQTMEQLVTECAATDFFYIAGYEKIEMTRQYTGVLNDARKPNTTSNRDVRTDVENTEADEEGPEAAEEEADAAEEALDATEAADAAEEADAAAEEKADKEENAASAAIVEEIISKAKSVAEAEDSAAKEAAIDFDPDENEAGEPNIDVDDIKSLVRATKGLFEGIVFKTLDSSYNTATFYKAKPHYIDEERVELVLLGHYSVNNAGSAMADRFVFGTTDSSQRSRNYPWKGYVPVFEFAAFGSNGMTTAVRLACNTEKLKMRQYVAAAAERDTVVGRMTKVVKSPTLHVSFNPDRVYKLTAPASIRKWDPVEVYFHAVDGGRLERGTLTPLGDINKRGVVVA